MNQIDITAIGVLAGQIQVPVQQLKVIARELGIHPEALINGVPHFNRVDTERIAAHIREAQSPEPLTPTEAR